MKTNILVMLLGLVASAGAFAQETDDMYFNSKDRIKSNELNNIALAKRYQAEDRDAVRTNPVNPSDSYSGRGVNPEYLAQGKNGTTVVQNQPDYFIPGYQPKVNSSLYQGTGAYANPNNCNCGYNPNMTYNGFGSPYGYNPYAPMYSPYGQGSIYSPFNSMYSGMYSPYGYGGMYSPYMASMYSPYGMSPGLSMGMGYGFGSMGSMMSIGLGYMWGSPMGMYGMGYPMSYGMGYGMGMGMYGMPYYPTTVVVTDSRPSYARSPRQSTAYNYVGNTSTGGSVSSPSRGAQGGRSANPNYYDSSWRNNASNYSTRSAWSQGAGGNTRSSWGNSGWNTGGTRSSFDSFGSRGSFGGGGGFSGGSGGGHSRGRH